LEKEDFQVGQPQFAIPHQTEMLTQIWGGTQNIQKSMRNMNTRIDKVGQRIERIEDQINGLNVINTNNYIIIMLLLLLL